MSGGLAAERGRVLMRVSRLEGVRRRGYPNRRMVVM